MENAEEGESTSSQEDSDQEKEYSTAPTKKRQYNFHTRKKASTRGEASLRQHRRLLASRPEIRF